MFRVLSFLVIGGGAFLLTVAAYKAFTAVGVAPYIAQPLALWLSMTSTWLLNRRFTFASKIPPSFEEYGRYLLLSSLGAGVNYALFVTLLFAGSADLLALAAGTVGGTFFNFFAYDRLVFASDKMDRTRKPKGNSETPNIPGALPALGGHEQDRAASRENMRCH